MDDMRSRKAMQKRPGQLFPHGQQQDQGASHKNLTSDSNCGEEWWYGIPCSYGVKGKRASNGQSNLLMDPQVTDQDTALALTKFNS